MGVSILFNGLVEIAKIIFPGISSLGIVSLVLAAWTAASVHSTETKKVMPKDLRWQTTGVFVLIQAIALVLFLALQGWTNMLLTFGTTAVASLITGLIFYWLLGSFSKAVIRGPKSK